MTDVLDGLSTKSRFSRMNNDSLAMCVSLLPLPKVSHPISKNVVGENQNKST